VQTIQSSELYTDHGQYAVMTRTNVLDYAKLARIADNLCHNAESLLFSANAPTVDDCRIAGRLLGLAYRLVPLRIGIKVDH